MQASGGKHEGDYENDVKHGKGKYTYPNGDVYTGQWKDGLKHGKGVYKYKADGGVWVSLSLSYINDKPGIDISLLRNNFKLFETQAYLIATIQDSD